MAKIFFSDIQSVTLNYHTPSLNRSRSLFYLVPQEKNFKVDSLDGSTSDRLEIGLNSAISELYPVFSSRCTYQVFYIIRRTPRDSSKKIFQVVVEVMQAIVYYIWYSGGEPQF